MSLSSVYRQYRHHVMKEYSLLSLIGYGTTSEVFIGLHLITNRMIAAKVVKRYRLSKAEDEGVLFEIELMKMFKHKHIVKMIDFMVIPRNIYIIQEYCDGGNLMEYIIKHGKLSEETCQQVIQQLASAIKYMRSNNICHLDLKPDNIFLIKSKTITIKLGDFGLSKEMAEDTKNYHFCGSFIYMAPEMLVNNEFGIKADLWSIGIIMYECLFGRPPYPVTNHESIKCLVEKMKLQKPIRIPSADIISPTCINLLQSLLQHDPSKRLNHQQFYSHPFVNLDGSSCQESYTATYLEFESYDEPTDNESTDKESSIDDQFTDDVSTNDQVADNQAVDEQATNDPAVDTSLTATVITVKKVKRLEKWFNAFIGIFKRKNT